MNKPSFIPRILELQGFAEQILATCDQLLNEADSPPSPTVEVPRNKTRLLIPSDWPRPGGRDFAPAPTDLFQSEAYRDRYSPSGETRAIYAGACDGLGHLARALQIPLYKVSTTSSARVADRMKELRLDRYGAVWRKGKTYVADEQGWDSWFPSHMFARSLPSKNSPVRCDIRAILVDLPVGLKPEDFDRSFDAEVAKGAIDRWLLTEEGRNHAAALGVDPAIGQRLTAIAGGDTPKLSPATEIAVFCTKYSGPDRLIAIAETIVLKHLGLVD